MAGEIPVEEPEGEKIKPIEENEEVPKEGDQPPKQPQPAKQKVQIVEENKHLPVMREPETNPFITKSVTFSGFHSRPPSFVREKV